MSTASGHRMGDNDESGVTGGATPERLGRALKEHGPLLGRVAMALVGEVGTATRALEAAARDAATKSLPDGDEATKVLLLGCVRTACAVQQSRLPSRGSSDGSPRTERMGSDVATRARDKMASLRPTERDAVVLHLVGGLGIAAIATACNIAEDAARTRLSRGLAQLRGGSK